MPLVRKSSGSVQPAPAPAAASVLDGLASTNEDTRWAAARAAAELPECGPALAAALRVEAVPRVRTAMLTSLARRGDAGSAAAMLPLLRSDDASLRAAALDALRLLIHGTTDLLPALLDDPDADIRILSCELARMLPGETATPLLCELLGREREVNVCAVAVDVLAEVGQREALPVLAQCAARFPHDPFLPFAIQVASDRISTRPPHPRA
jgi:HEAT repeat protein